MSQLIGKKLVIASHNQGKVREIADLLAPYGIDVSTSSDFNVTEPEETEDTFVGNALLKARITAEATGLPSLADDSGLVVAGLGDQPGVYSARWAEQTDGTRDFKAAMNRVERELGDNPNRDAYFVCVLALAWPDGRSDTFEGRVYGQLTFPARGDNGFGYDPIFIPNGYEMTFGEMDPSEKKAISHRAKAFDLFVSKCF